MLTLLFLSLQWSDHRHSLGCPSWLNLLPGVIFPGHALPQRTCHPSQEGYEEVPGERRGETLQNTQLYLLDWFNCICYDDENPLGITGLFVAELWAAGSWRERHQGSCPPSEALRAEKSQSPWRGCFWHCAQGTNWPGFVRLSLIIHRFVCSSTFNLFLRAFGLQKERR